LGIGILFKNASPKSIARSKVRHISHGINRVLATNLLAVFALMFSVASFTACTELFSDECTQMTPQEKTSAEKLIRLYRTQAYGARSADGFIMTYQVLSAQRCGSKLTMIYGPDLGVVGAILQYEVDLSNQEVIQTHVE
jgi:hypothetical protein